MEDIGQFQDVLEVRIDSQNVSNLHCLCPFFLKHLTCKHSLGMLIQLELCDDVPLKAKSVPLGQKRKRGRSAAAKKALLQQ